MSSFSYDKWVADQVQTITAQIRPLALGGRFSAAVYAFRSNGAEPGHLSVCEEQPAGAVECVRLGTYGSRVMSVPSTALASLLWHACRNLPICPTVEA
jgi:hypothetical protein